MSYKHKRSDVPGKVPVAADFKDGEILVNTADGRAFINTPSGVETLPNKNDVSVLSGFRNKIINGDFDIWQRGNSQSTGDYGSDDRWRNDRSGYTRTHAQQTFPIGEPNVPGSPTFFSRTVITVAGTEAGHLCSKSQLIEGVKVLAGKTATLTFWAKADAARKIVAELAQNFGVGASPEVNNIGTTTCNLTTSWQKFSIPIQVPSIAGKTVGDGNSLNLNFWFGAGSDFNARTNSLGHQTGTFDIAHVSLVEGDATAEADPFSPRHIQQELELCQRYYVRMSGIGLNYNAYTVDAIGSWWISFPTTMRATPTLGSRFVDGDYSQLASLTWAIATRYGARLLARANASNNRYFNMSGGDYIEASVEL